MQAIRPSREEEVDREGLKYVENPTGEQMLLSGGEAAQAHWPAPMAPIARSSGHESDQVHNQEHHHNDLEHHHKKSMLAKVKEKAKKWKSVLTKKKHEGSSTSSTPNTASSATTPNSESTADEYDESVGLDPEYHGPPMYESEMAPKMYKERASKLQAGVPSPKTPQPILDHGPTVPAHEPLSALEADRIISQQQRAGPLCAHEADGNTSPRHQRTSPIIGTPNSTDSTVHLGTRQPTNSTVHFAPIITAAAPQQQGTHDTAGEPRLERLDSFKEPSRGLHPIAPANVHTEVKESETKEGGHDSSKTLTETVSEMLAPAYNMVSEATTKIAAKIQSPGVTDEIGAKVMWDKGVSVKDYLLQKLEPGEEEKALSQVITEVISPKKVGPGLDEDKGVVEIVKGAVSALLGKDDEGTGAQQSPPNTDVHQTSSRPLFKNTEGSPILTGQYKDETLVGAPKVTQEVSNTSYAHGASIPPPKYTHQATIAVTSDARGAATPHSKGNHGASIHASQDARGTSNPPSEYSLGALIPDLLLLSESPLMAPTSASTSPAAVPENSSLANASMEESISQNSTNPFENASVTRDSTNPFEEANETNGRRLQAYTN